MSIAVFGGTMGISGRLSVTGRIDTGRAVRNREYQLDETRLDKEQIVNLSNVLQNNS
jgi:hypothetical protein